MLSYNKIRKQKKANTSWQHSEIYYSVLERYQNLCHSYRMDFIATQNFPSLKTQRTL